MLEQLESREAEKCGTDPSVQLRLAGHNALLQAISEPLIVKLEAMPFPPCKRGEGFADADRCRHAKPIPTGPQVVGTQSRARAQRNGSTRYG